MEIVETKAVSAGQKPADKISVSCHPELKGDVSTQEKQGYMAAIAVKPQGRFPDGWQAKQVNQAERRKDLVRGTGAASGEHHPDGRKSRNSRNRQNDRRTGHAHQKERVRQNGHAGYAGYSHQAHSERYVHCLRESEEYSSTCCGKCRHHLRIWRSRVWVCQNSRSEKCGFPTDYGNSCDFFGRDER